jgi:nitrilase
MNPMTVAAVQMVSSPVVRENLDAAARRVHEAAAAGARLVVLPEYFCIMGRHELDKVAAREVPGQGPIQDFLAEQAARESIWLVAGCVPLACDDPHRVRSACLVYAPDGRCRVRYDKIHLFSFAAGAERYREANTIEPGDTPVAFDLEGMRVGLSICYDLRFPELYRALGVCDLLLVPSAFTATTGVPHWEVLLRARAIENQAWVLAAAQGGLHPNGRRTHGDTMIVDPWGQVLARRAEGEGVVTARLDPAERDRVRAGLPALDHRVLGLPAQ